MSKIVQALRHNFFVPVIGVVAAMLTACAPLPAVTPVAPTTPVAAAPAGEIAAACAAPLAPTEANPQGPYYKPGTPDRSSLLESGMSGTQLIVSGRVLATDCTPIADAQLEFWQADADGVYDNAGFTLRGQIRSDAQGGYQLETIVPGIYPGRTRHIHVKVTTPDGRDLVTQLYFAGEPLNERDRLFRSSLAMTLAPAANGTQTAAFDFVLE